MISYIIAGVGIVLTFIGIVLTVKSKTQIEPYVHYKNIREIEKVSTNENIKVLYQDKEVNNISTTKIWFWNNGNRPLRKEDIPIGDTIKVLLKDDRIHPVILDYAVKKISKDIIKVALNAVNENTLSIDFNYFDKGDGVLVEIQHTGTDNTKVSITGEIFGPKKDYHIIYPKGRESANFAMILSYIAGSSGFLLYKLLIKYHPVLLVKPWDFLTNFLTIVVSIVISLLAFGCVLYLGLKSPVPKKLRIDEAKSRRSKYYSHHKHLDSRIHRNDN